jgi:phosphonate degradation associated HDIG domain protein
MIFASKTGQMSDIGLGPLFGLLRDKGAAQYAGEEVTQLQHALQCAALAEAEGHDSNVVLAALFHDIGHLIVHADVEVYPNYLGHVNHELLGANALLQAGLPKDMCLIVAAHVQAKRYLCLRDSAYHDSLSKASQQTLALQGGPMRENEVIIWESEPYWPLAIRLRHWDDAAKDPSVQCPPLSHYEAMARRLRYLPKGDEQT